MPTDIREPTLSSRSASTPARALPRPARRRGRWPNPLSTVVLAFFLLFFTLPVLWLVLAATKTDDQLVHGHPLSFG
ncbi:MAG: carbohydrate ABC transporter permease, partial [Kibdelosporangium sp.]